MTPVSELIVSDDELWAAYQETPSSKKLERIYGISERQIRTRLARIRDRMGEHVKTADVDLAGKFEQQLASVPLVGPNGAHLREISLKQYGVGAKDELTQKIVTEGMSSTGARYVFNVAKTKVEWPPITPYYHVPAFTYLPTPGPIDNSFERVFVFGDVQAHYWRENDGTYTPFHDEKAIDVALQALARYRPHKVVILGDFWDAPGLGRYRKEPAFAFVMNRTIAYCTWLIARIRAIVGPDCEIIFLLGNHEARLEISILENLMELYGIRRPGDTFSLLSIPFLLSFDKYNVKVSEQYPSGAVWLTNDLVCRHAPENDTAATQVCGHKVKATVESKPMHYRDGKRTYKTYIVPGFGDYGAIPKDRQRVSRTNIPSGRARSGAEQAFATIDITWDKKRHSVHVWEIVDGCAFFRDDGLLEGNPTPFEYQEVA